MSTTHTSFESQIEQLVREHIAASRRAAAAAIERAFRETTTSRPKQAREALVRKTAKRRRTPEEMAALGERLYEAILSHPGVTMSVLASELGVPAHELSLPATALRGAGRLRSAGKRQFTRYFPMLSKSNTKL